MSGEIKGRSPEEMVEKVADIMAEFQADGLSGAEVKEILKRAQKAVDEHNVFFPTEKEELESGTPPVTGVELRVEGSLPITINLYRMSSGQLRLHSQQPALLGALFK